MIVHKIVSHKILDKTETFSPYVQSECINLFPSLKLTFFFSTINLRIRTKTVLRSFFNLRKI